MRLVERIGNLDGELQHLLDRQRTFRRRCASVSPSILHHKIIDIVLVTGVVEGADVRMVQAGDGFRFAVESFAQFRMVGEVVGKNLDGDDSIEARVASFVNLAHSARTDGGEDFVGP